MGLVVEVHTQDREGVTRGFEQLGTPDAVDLRVLGDIEWQGARIGPLHVNVLLDRTFQSFGSALGAEAWTWLFKALRRVKDTHWNETRSTIKDVAHRWVNDIETAPEEDVGALSELDWSQVPPGSTIHYTTFRLWDEREIVVGTPSKLDWAQLPPGSEVRCTIRPDEKASWAVEIPADPRL
jgi:hypothetical protein